MNPVQMQRLVDAMLDTSDEAFEASPVTDQVDAALKDLHNQSLLIDTLFRTMARDVFAIIGEDVDVHRHAVGFSVDIRQVDEPAAVALVADTLCAYLCGKPHTVHEALETFKERSDGRGTQVFGVLVGIALVLRRRQMRISVTPL